MAALARWNPQPVVPQPVCVPIKRQYQLARLHEQLHTATNGGRVNIFKVVGFGAGHQPPSSASLSHQRFLSSDAQQQQMMLLDSDDAPGEPDTTTSFSRRSSSFSISGGVPQRRPSVTSRA